MLRSYLTLARRVSGKHALYSVINVFGLGLGLTVVLLIAVYVRFERGYDRFHDRADNIYRIVQEQPGNVFLGSNRFAVTPQALAPALRDELPYVEASTQINDIHGLVTTDDGPSFFSDGLFATPSFLDVFSFDLLQGDAATVLVEPNSVIVTPELAQSVFGTTDAVGRELDIVYYSSKYHLTVSGIIESPPPNSHFDFSYVISYEGLPGRAKDHWGSSNFYTYAVLRPGISIDRLDADVQAIAGRNMANLSWIKEGGGDVPRFYAQPLSDIHLRSHINFELSQNGDIRYIWLLSIAAGIILATACVNYTNLSTARAGTRAREVGIRKVSGADRGQLARQFMGESVITAVAASFLALALTAILLPAFSAIVERDISRSTLMSVWFLGTVPALGILVGTVSGWYPAVVLSRLVPAQVLKSGSSLRMSRSLLRNGLVVGQFAVGIMLVIGTIVIERQLQYIRTAETGMDRDHIVAVTVRDRGLGESWQTVKGELARIPGVRQVSASDHMPTNIQSSNGVDDWTGHQDGQELSMYTTRVNHNFFDVLGLKIVEGRGFSQEFPADEGEAIVINQTAMRALGWDTAVGKEIDLGSRGSKVIGVMKDFQFHSFHQRIMPLALSLHTESIGRVLVKVRPDELSTTISGLGDAFARLAPTFPFEYQFLDDAYDSMYRAEQRQGTLLSIITGLALVIACLGLFGLAAFLTLQRTREIGLRKALGASSGDIVLLLSREFARPVLLAFVVAAPISYFMAQKWLAEFAFRVDVGPAIFALAALFTAVAMLLTVGYQSLKAALTDPVVALRHE